MAESDHFDSIISTAPAMGFRFKSKIVKTHFQEALDVHVNISKALSNSESKKRKVLIIGLQQKKSELY